MPDSRCGARNSWDGPGTSCHSETLSKRSESCKSKEALTGQEETVICWYPCVYYNNIKNYSLIITSKLRNASKLRKLLRR